MKLYEYYKTRTNEDGTLELYIIPDPLPQDGYSYEPLAYACDDEDFTEEYIAEKKLNFTGINTNFSGDHGDITIVDIIPGVDEVSMDTLKEHLNHPSNQYIVNKNDPIFYRTGIYFEESEEDEYTGFDIIYHIALD